MKYRLILLFLLLSSAIYSQNTTGNSSELIQLKDLARMFKAEYDSIRSLAEETAKAQNRPLRYKDDNGDVIEIHGITPTGELIYYITDNLDAAKTVSTDKVWPGGGLGLNLTGGSVNVGEWDGGGVLLTHHELVSRVNQVDVPFQVEDHATHVAGTMIASGVIPAAKGMAYAANLNAFDWNSDNSEMATAASNGMLISNHSYGSIAGWRYNNGLARWEWWGDTTISTVEDYKFGFYNSSARAWDLIAKSAPYYLIVKSAGNDRGDFHNGAHYLANSGIQSSASRNADGGPSGYDCVTTYGNAKNILTVGAVNAIPSGYSAPTDVVMSSFSGWGPTDDGRIKPDIVANGVGVYSSLATHDSAYASYNGTSMAAPNTAGSLVLIQQHFQNENSAYMLSATLKGLIIHTADEAGTALGPDYQFGWGLLNTAASVSHISNSSGRDEIIETTLNNNQTYELVVTSDGLTPLRATICWTDEAGTVPAISLDPTTKMLVNDLDLRIIEDTNSTINYPYILNPASPASAATTGDNTLDNVEQVYIASPTAGTYTIRITHKGTLFSSQNFSLIISGGVTAVTPIVCGQFFNTFPYSEDFETFSNCSAVPTSPCVLPSISGWQNIGNDSIDWTVFNGPTSTASTGPSVDFNPGTVSGKYLYLESSGLGNPSKEAILLSPCFDIDLLTKPEFSFGYNMEGTNMGSLSLDINTGISWTNLWYASGDQGSGWQKAFIDLTAFKGDTIQLRFRGITGNGDLSDMALDDIVLKDNPFSCNLTIGTFPYIQDFESFGICSTTPAASCVLPSSSGFQNLSGDDLDWTTDNNGTVSSGTGPTTDYNPGTSLGKYLYVEASAPGGNPNMEAILNFPCFDLSTLSNTELSFAYHMYGTDMGYLYVDVDSGNGWNNVWFINGNIGDFWNKANLDLSDYDGKDIQIRMRGVTGSGFESDIAIDDIRIGGPTPKTYCVSTAINSIDTYVEEVILESISNNTIAVCGVYSDFTNFVANLERDSIYSLSVKTGDCDGGSFYSHGVNVYIDWDNDAQFSGVNETVLTRGVGAAATTVVNVTVPAWAALDTVRMRVVCSEDAPITPCGSYGYGETEDYSIIITSGPPNDICDNAIALNCGNPLIGSTIEATDDLLAPNCITNVSAPGVWYKVVGNGSPMEVNLCGSATNYDTRLNIYSGTCSSLICETGNDNSCGNSSLVNWNSSVGQTYYILVQGSSGQTGNFEIALNSSPPSSITANGSTTFCDGGSVLLTADTAASHQWMFNSTILSASSSTLQVSNSGTYKVINTDFNGCTDTTSPGTIVTVNSLPVVTIGTSGTTTFCDGGSVTLSSTPGANYTWYKNGIPLSGANSINYAANQSGSYNVVMEDANGCSDSASAAISVTVNALPTVSVNATGSTTICEQDSVQLNTVSGSSYQWYLNGVPLAGGTSQNFQAKSQGIYNAIVTDGNNCSDSASTGIGVFVNPLPNVIITLSASPTFCEGDSIQLNTISGAGFQWFLNGSSISGGTSSGLQVKAQGNYNVVVTNSNNCSDSASSGTGIIVNPLPIVSITPNGPTTFCEGDSLEITTNTTGTYQWLKNGVGIPNSTNTNHITYLPGNYNVIVTDGNNCEDSASTAIGVTVNPLPIVNITILGDSIICENDSTFLQASLGLTYQWLKEGVTLANETTNQLKVFESGKYNVVVKDVIGCSDSAMFSQIITVNPLPVVDFNAIPILCNTISSYLLTEGSPFGGVYNGAGVSSDSIFDPSSAGTGIHMLYYSYIDQNGCMNLDSVEAEVVNCVGIDKATGVSEITIYPNPAKEVLNIELGKDLRATTMRLLNLEGKLIINKNQFEDIGNGIIQLQLSGISKGLYLLEVNTSSSFNYYKIVIQ